MLLLAQYIACLLWTTIRNGLKVEIRFPVLLSLVLLAIANLKDAFPLFDGMFSIASFVFGTALPLTLALLAFGPPLLHWRGRNLGFWSVYITALLLLFAVVWPKEARQLCWKPTMWHFSSQPAAASHYPRCIPSP